MKRELEHTTYQWPGESIYNQQQLHSHHSYCVAVLKALPVAASMPLLPMGRGIPAGTGQMMNCQYI